ncbi:MAG: FAD-binding protein [Eggerthellaceae bacterium]
MLADKRDTYGGESFMACGVMNVSGSEMQKRAGIEGSVEEKWEKYAPVLEKKGETDDMEYKKNVYLGQTEWANRVEADYGAQFQPLEAYKDTGAPTSMLLPLNGIGDMTSVLTPLINGLQDKGATVELNRKATNFIVDSEGPSLAFASSTPRPTKLDVKAKKIVLATGGFSCNQVMVSNMPQQAELCPLTVYSMGGGHELGRSIGGVYAHMDMDSNRMSDLAQVTVWGYFGRNVQVSPMGRRFIKEDQSHDTPDACAELGLGFWWTIFDNQLIEGSQAWNVEMNMKAHEDRLVGSLQHARRARAGHGRSRRKPQGHLRRIRRLRGCGRGRGVRQKLFLEKLEAPYYALKHFPFRYKTHGGLKIATDSQLVDNQGNPIANVYCCGSTTPDTGSDLSPNAGSGLITGKAVVASLQSEQA